MMDTAKQFYNIKHYLKGYLNLKKKELKLWFG